MRKFERNSIHPLRTKIKQQLSSAKNLITYALLFPFSCNNLNFCRSTENPDRIVIYAAVAVIIEKNDNVIFSVGYNTKYICPDAATKPSKVKREMRNRGDNVRKTHKFCKKMAKKAKVILSEDMFIVGKEDQEFEAFMREVRIKIADKVWDHWGAEYPVIRQNIEYMASMSRFQNIQGFGPFSAN